MQQIFKPITFFITIVISLLLSLFSVNAQNNEEDFGQGFIHTFNEAPEDINEVLEFKPSTLEFTKFGETKNVDVYYTGSEPIIGAELHFEFEGVEITDITIVSGTSLYVNPLTQEAHLASLDEIPVGSKLLTLTLESVSVNSLDNFKVDTGKSTIIGKNIEVRTTTPVPSYVASSNPTNPIEPVPISSIYPFVFTMISVILSLIFIIILILMLRPKTSKKMEPEIQPKIQKDPLSPPVNDNQN